MEFQTDFIVSWDISDKDFPCVQISRLRSDGKATRLVLDVIGNSNAKCGVVSVRQLLAEFDATKSAAGG